MTRKTRTVKVLATLLVAGIAAMSAGCARQPTAPVLPIPENPPTLEVPPPLT